MSKKMTKEQEALLFEYAYHNDRANDKIKIFVLIFMIMVFFMGKYYITINPEYTKYLSFSLNDLTIEGLFLSNFMHANLIHLFMNSLAAFFLFGRLFFISRSSLLLLMGISAIGSLLVSGIFMPSQAVLVGFSGVLYGFLCVFLLYLYDIKKSLTPHYQSMVKRCLIINGILSLGINFVPHIGWFAHLGGAIAGVLFYFILKYYNKIDYRNLTVSYMCYKGF